MGRAVPAWSIHRRHALCALHHVPSPAVAQLKQGQMSEKRGELPEACRRMGSQRSPSAPPPTCSRGTPGGSGAPCGPCCTRSREESPAAAHAAPALPGPLAGFALFYVSVMSLLFLAYCKLWGF
nr:leucine-rich repeat and calponin homology domain-containing protein 4-like [Chelonoidis abingdonii]